MTTQINKSEIRAIRQKVEMLEMHLHRTAEPSEYTESLRTDLILSIIASDFVGQELIRRIDAARSCAPDLLRDTLKATSDSYGQMADEMPDEYKSALKSLEMAEDRDNSRHTNGDKWFMVNGKLTQQSAKAPTTMADLMSKHGGYFVPSKGYEQLFQVLMDAHNQAALGKGKERHANDLPFHEQRMQQISTLLNSPDGMAYQVAKKVAEGLQMRDPDARDRELLGAIVYTAGILVWLRNQPKVED